MAEATRPSPPAAHNSEPRGRKQWIADLSLLGVVAVWGATFILVKDVVGKTAPLLFVSVRFGLAALALLLVGLLQGKLRRSQFNRQEVWGGAAIGVALWGGYSFQTIGLQYTSASNAGFIVGLSVALVPIFSFFALRYRPSASALVGVALAVVGLGLLTIQDNFSINGGDWWEIVSATSFGMQIVLVARFVPRADSLRLALVEISVTAAISLGLSLLIEYPTVGWWLPSDVLVAALFMGVVATAAAMTAQATAQRYTSPIHTAIIFTLEPVFAALFGFIIAGEHLNGRQIAGCALILMGMLLAELAPYLRNLLTKNRPT